MGFLEFNVPIGKEKGCAGLESIFLDRTDSQVGIFSSMNVSPLRRKTGFKNNRVYGIPN